MAPTIGTQVEFWPRQRNIYQPVTDNQPFAAVVTGVHPFKKSGDSGFSSDQPQLVNLTVFDGAGRSRPVTNVAWRETMDGALVDYDSCAPPPRTYANTLTKQVYGPTVEDGGMQPHVVNFKREDDSADFREPVSAIAEPEAGDTDDTTDIDND